MNDERTKTASSEAELKHLRALQEEDIDLQDIPEVRDWSGARRGALYRPVKQQLTLRLDADIVAWFRARCPDGGYQTAINQALRQHVQRVERSPER